MKPSILFILLIIKAIPCMAQWSGVYEGELNGDKVVVRLTLLNGNKIEGEMKDSHQQFKITGEVNGNRMAGDAIEPSLGLKCVLLGERKNNKSIDFKLITKILGLTSEVPFTVFKKNLAENTPKPNKDPKTSVLPNQNRDTRLVGRWTKSESYNSGYGDNFMGANFSQVIILFGDGSVADGGSDATISGKNYYGQSKGNSKTVQGLTWFTKDNQLYFSYTQNGQTQTESVGKYYVEDNKMLITQKNGQKILLTK
ncbi:MAG: hypothetical protein ACK4GN_16950 [Runella sp.]